MKTLSPRGVHPRISPRRILCGFAMLVLVLTTISASFGAEETRTFSSVYWATRTSTSTGLFDWWQVDSAPGRLISLYGYNNGSQQFLQVFDAKNGPTNIISGFDSNTEILTCANHDLRSGQPIQLTGTVGGLSAGIYYVGTIDASTFYLYDTAAHAIALGSTGKQNLTGASATATLNKLPLHTFAIGAADNYSCIIQLTGFAYNKGLVVAVSTTAATYTAGTKDVTALVTVGSP